VANRLTESGKFRVLVLEAGPDPNVVAAYKPLGGNSLITGTTEHNSRDYGLMNSRVAD
jgi:choline dehydrogenase-like flavoprotein